MHCSNNRGRHQWEPADRVQGGDDGGRTQGEDRRGLEQEKPSWTKAAAMMLTHDGIERWRSHGGGMATDSRGPTNTGGARVVEESKVQTESQ